MVARSIQAAVSVSLGAVLVAATTGCAQQPLRSDGGQVADAPSVRSGRAATRAAEDGLEAARQAAGRGDWARAQAGFAAALREDLRNPQLQFLNGLAYQQLSRRGDRGLLDLARVGFQNAVQFDPGHYWAQLHLGYLELEDGRYDTAQEAFAKAVAGQPQRWEAVYGLGVASYYAGDTLLARLAAERLRQIDPAHPNTLRLRALTMAAAGEADAESVAAELRSTDPVDRFTQRRVGELLRRAAFQQDPDGFGQEDESPGEWDDPAPSARAGGQVVIDVTLILSSQVQTTTRGINLFDGLTAQYGYNNSFSAFRASGADWSSSRSITSNIGIPQLTYSLNLFNDSGQAYQVLARPSLTAYVGRESEFFAGRTVNVGISGINLGSLQPIDVGVGLKVTPESIEGEKVTFQVNANRSFLSREQVGTFSESLTTFKQLVSATAEVDFGQTLILSALSEQVRDSTFSKTPGLGDVPVVSTLFNSRVALERTESLLVLVTPLRPTTVATRDRESPATVERLRTGWDTWIEPRSDVAAIVRRLEAQRFFTQAQAGDLRWRSAIGPAELEEALAENVLLARR